MCFNQYKPSNLVFKNVKFKRIDIDMKTLNQFQIPVSEVSISYQNSITGVTISRCANDIYVYRAIYINFRFDKMQDRTN